MSKKQVAPSKGSMLTWVIPVMAVAVLGGYLVGQKVGSREAGNDALTSVAAAATTGAANTDIASMSPQERANHLYDRSRSSTASATSRRWRFRRTHRSAPPTRIFTTTSA